MSIKKRVVFEGNSMEVFDHVKAALDEAHVKYHVREEGMETAGVPKIVANPAYANATSPYGSTLVAPAAFPLFIYREGEEAIHEILVAKGDFEKANTIVHTFA